MFSAPNISTGGYMNQISRVIETPEQENREWLLLQHKLGRSRVVKYIDFKCTGL